MKTCNCKYFVCEHLNDGWIMACEHKNTEYIPQEDDTNVREDVICVDCGRSIIDQIEETK